jgi:urease accessory protein
MSFSQYPAPRSGCHAPRSTGHRTVFASNAFEPETCGERLQRAVSQSSAMRAEWLDALQVLDSSFPTGAYVHSFGLETLAPVGLSQLERALRLRLRESLARLELVFLLHAYTDDLIDLDERFHALLLVREPREASALIGTQLLRAACELFPIPRLESFLCDGRHHHQPLAYGALAAALGLPPELAADAYAFSSLRAQVTASQRLGWLGQRDAQRLLHALKPAARAAVDQASRMALDEAGAFAPAWDVACMAHERAPARMFAS